MFHPRPLRLAFLRFFALPGALFATLLCGFAQPADSTALFEEWVAAMDHHPQIPNNVFAGYRRGEVPLPTRPVVNQVTDFGADPTGQADSTAAFRAAIRDAHNKGGGTILIPNGDYRIDGFIWVRFDGIILRGESREGVHLHFLNHLETVSGSSYSGQSSRYAWLGGLIWVAHSNAFAINFEDTGEGAASARRSEFILDDAYAVPLLARVTEAAAAGDRTITVDSTEGLRAGQMVLLRFSIRGHGYAFQKAISGSDHVRNNYNWGFHTTLEYGDGKGFQWMVEVAAVEGDTLRLAQPLRFPVDPAWSPEIVDVARTEAVIREVGIESLTIRLDSNNEGTYQHLRDKGWNGIFINRAVDCWVRDVTVADGENGILLAAVKQSTVSDVLITEFTDRANTWHHALNARVMSADVLFEDFVFEVNHRIDHGFNSEAYSNGLVWRRGTMNHGTFDSHRVMPFDQIRTDIFAVNPSGSGSGGNNNNGPHVGQRTVHWNTETVARGIWIHHEELFSGGAMVGYRGPVLTGCPGNASTVCGTPGQKNNIFLEAGSTPAITDLYAAQVAAWREVYGSVAIGEPWEHTMDAAHRIPTITVYGELPGGRTLDRVEIRAGEELLHTAATLPVSFDWEDAPLGEHFLTARLVDTAGGWIESIPRRFVYARVLFTSYDDPNLTFSPGHWSAQSDPRHRDGEIRFADTRGAWVEYTFRGTAISFFGANVSNQRRNQFEVYLNGELIDYFTDRSGEVFQYPMWHSGPLPEGNHTLRLVLDNRDQPPGERAMFDFFRVEATAAGTFPSAAFTLHPATGSAPLEVAFDASGSLAPEGETLEAWEWDFGDGVTADGPQVTHTFEQGGTYLVRLTVRASSGLSAVTQRVVEVTEPPRPHSITLSPVQPVIAPGETLAFTALLVDQFGNDYNPQPASFAWSATGGGSISAAGLFAAGFASGEYTVTASADDLVGSTLVTIRPAQANTFVESGGLAVIEAENFHALERNGDSVEWAFSDTLAGYAGEGYLALPEAAVPNAGWPNGAEAIYLIRIQAPGVYYLNIRRIAPSAAFDSLLVGVNGQLRAARAFEGTSPAWAWTAANRIVDLGFLGEGEHTLHLQRREAGMKVDRLMIALDPAALLPGSSEVGPPESAREGTADPFAAFAAWMADPVHGVPPEARGPQDSPAGDGVANLLKFVFGDGPLDPVNPAEWFRLCREGEEWRLHVRVRDRAHLFPLHFGASGDLLEWTPLLPPLLHEETLPDGSLQRTHSADLAAGPFFRVRLTP